MHTYTHIYIYIYIYILRRALDFEVEGQGKKVRLKKTLKKQLEEESFFCWFENGRSTLPIKMECWHYSDCCWIDLNLATLNFLGKLPSI